MTNLKNEPETLLDFSPEAREMLTGFREKVLIDIYRAAVELCGDKLKSAEVIVDDTLSEGDSWNLDLAMLVDADWDMIFKWGRAIVEKTCEWSNEWSEEENEDHARRIDFGFVPVDL